MGRIKSSVKAFLDENTGCISPEYGKLPANAEYVSFDIFDTLVVRTLNKPADLFALLEKELGIPGFGEKRKKAEKDARLKKTGGEVTLREIYGCFPCAAEQDIENFCRSELEAELSVCRPNGRMISLYRECLKNRHVVLTSDMYLPSDMMEKILGRCGITGYEKLYISCEAGASKRSRGLYRHVISDLGTSPGNIVHIGNDIIGDYVCAKMAGLKSVKIRTMPARNTGGVCGGTKARNVQRNTDRQARSDTMVSVVIPIYNVEKYLRECVDSVLGQTYGNIEVILVDDGSPDGCGAICDEYARLDSRVSVIHKENGGLSDARNAGMDKARGKYIYFLDSDDYILPDAIERLVKRAEETQSDIVFMDGENFNEEGFVPDIIESLTHDKEYAPVSGTEALNDMFHSFDYFICAIWVHFYRLDFLRSNKLRFVKGLIFEDLMFSGTAFPKAERVCSLNEKLYMRRMRADSIMTSRGSLLKVKSYAYIFKRFLDEYNNEPVGSPEKEAYGNLLVVAANMCVFRYAEVRGGEEPASRRIVEKVRRTLEKYDYFGSRKIKVKYKTVGLYRLYMTAKNNAIKLAYTAKGKVSGSR